jgi:hypothetical protein
MTMQSLPHKDKEENMENATSQKQKCVAALPCNRPFAATHMLFYRPTY